ncbi:AAA family ATPase [Pectobacterium brasiliense]|uniref:AAA family ATPase n=1 Tax=Pectobacterium brasiliense TaxID=180957 RepID=UPI0032AF239F
MAMVIICVVTAVSWGCHIATGKPWAGKLVTQGVVIYVVSEGGTRSLVQDDMRAMGFDVNKKFTRWLDKLEKDGLIAFEGERITPLSQRNKVGDVYDRFP